MTKNREKDALSNATEKLKNAVMNGNIGKVKSLLKENIVDINARIRYTNNPNIAEYIALIWAAEKGYIEITKMLLEHPNINVNIKDIQGFTALMCAAEQGHDEVVELLLKQPNINVNIQNNKGATALIQAVKNGHKEVVIQLLNYSDIDVDIQTRNGISALDLAEIFKQKEIIELLLHSRRPRIDDDKPNLPKENISKNSLSEINYEKLKKTEWLSKITQMRVRESDFNIPQNSDGWTILMYATQYADIEIMQKILYEDNGNKNKFIDINVKNKYEDTSLTIAILMCDEKKMKLLLEYDSDIELVEKRDSKNPIKVNDSLSAKNFKILILKEWMLKIVRMRRRNEDFNTIVNYSDERTLLMCACASKYANCNIIKWILNEKDAEGKRVVNVNDKDKNGYTALTLATQSGNRKKMILLLKYGADRELAKKKASFNVREKLEEFNRQVQKASNNFLLAIKTRNYQKAKILMDDYPVDINIKLSQYGNTMLMSEADQGNKKAVELLLKHPNIKVNIQDTQGITALMCASFRGYKEIVKMLLDHGAEVNFQDLRQRFTALMCASQNGNDEIVKMLLDRGANVNVQGSRGQTPLMLAESYGLNTNMLMKNGGHMKVIKTLLEYGANINLRYENDDTALLFAVSNECEELVQLLLKYGADDYNKNTSLMIATVQGYEKIVRMLLEHGADVNSKNEYDITPLMNAITKGYTGIVDQLLKHGANVNVKDQFGNTPLIYSIRNGYPKIVKLLLEYGADINIKDQYDTTPLMHAVENGDSRIVKLLLNQQQNIDFNMVNYYGETLQSCAKKIGREKIVKLIQFKMEHESQSEPLQDQIKPPLIEYFEEEEKIKPKPKKSIRERFWEAVSQGDGNKMDSLLEEKYIDLENLINEKNKFGDTALIVSSQNGYINVIRSLLESNVDVSLENKKGDTALLIASDNNDLGIVKLLLSNNADPSLKDISGDNALIRAAKKDCFDVVEELIHRKSTIINSQGQDNRTALMVAAENGYIRLVKLLIKKGAKVNVKDNYGKTALDIVKEKIKGLNKTKNKKEINFEYYNNLKTIKNILEKKGNRLTEMFEDFSIKERLVDIWKVLTTNNYEEYKKFWKKNKPIIYNKIQKLYKDIELDPFRGGGQPEPLKGDLKGLYSRHIDKGNRLVYEVDGDTVFLMSCKGHYEQEKRKDSRSRTLSQR